MLQVKKPEKESEKGANNEKETETCLWCKQNLTNHSMHSLALNWKC